MSVKHLQAISDTDIKQATEESKAGEPVCLVESGNFRGYASRGEWFPVVLGGKHDAAPIEPKVEDEFESTEAEEK